MLPSEQAPDAAEAPPAVPALPPLAVSALVVTKADLVVALRIYVPQLTDISPLDGERFLLSVVPADPEQNGRPDAHQL